ncbi:unnamed protein product, partial [Iphiclides podalirius]
MVVPRWLSGGGGDGGGSVGGAGGPGGGGGGGRRMSPVGLCRRHATHAAPAPLALALLGSSRTRGDREHACEIPAGSRTRFRGRSLARRPSSCQIETSVVIAQRTTHNAPPPPPAGSRSRATKRARLGGARGLGAPGGAAAAARRVACTANNNL